jgi:hypothetical protein
MLYSEKAMLTKCINGSIKILREYFSNLFVYKFERFYLAISLPSDLAQR